MTSTTSQNILRATVALIEECMDDDGYTKALGVAMLAERLGVVANARHFLESIDYCFGYGLKKHGSGEYHLLLEIQKEALAEAVRPGILPRARALGIGPQKQLLLLKAVHERARESDEDRQLLVVSWGDAERLYRLSA